MANERVAHDNRKEMTSSTSLFFSLQQFLDSSRPHDSSNTRACSDATYLIADAITLCVVVLGPVN